MSDNLNNSNLPDYEQYDYVDELDFRVGFGKRFLAWFIDIVIFSGILFTVIVSTGIYDLYVEFFSTMMESGGASVDPNLMADFEQVGYQITMYSTVIGLLYFSLEVIYGATIGKMLMGLRIAHADRTWGSIQKLMIRSAIKNISFVFNVLFLATSAAIISTFGTILGFVAFIGCFVVLSEKKQALHDLIAGTAVYYKAEIMTPEEAEKVKNI